MARHRATPQMPQAEPLPVLPTTSFLLCPALLCIIPVFLYFSFSPSSQSTSACMYRSTASRILSQTSTLYSRACSPPRFDLCSSTHRLPFYASHTVSLRVFSSRTMTDRTFPLNTGAKIPALGLGESVYCNVADVDYDVAC